MKTMNFNSESDALDQLIQQALTDQAENAIRAPQDVLAAVMARIAAAPVTPAVAPPRASSWTGHLLVLWRNTASIGTIATIGAMLIGAFAILLLPQPGTVTPSPAALPAPARVFTPQPAPRSVESAAAPRTTTQPVATAAVMIVPSTPLPEVPQAKTTLTQTTDAAANVPFGATSMQAGGGGGFQRGIAWSPDGGRLLTSSPEGQLLLDADKLAVLRVYTAAQGSGQFSRDGRLHIDNGVELIIDPISGRVEQRNAAAPVNSVGISRPDAARMLALTATAIEVRNRASGAREFLIPLAAGHTVFARDAVALSADGRQLTYLDQALNRPVRLPIWDLERRVISRTIVSNLPPRADQPSLAVQVRFSDDGRRIALLHPTALEVFEVSSGRRVSQLALPAAGDLLGISTDGRRLLLRTFVGENEQLLLIDADAGNTRVLAETPGSHASSALAFSPDGRRLAVRRAASIELWDVAAARRTSTREMQPDEAASVLLTRADASVLTGYTGALGLRVFAPGEPLPERVIEAQGALQGFAVSHDGTRLALFDVDRGELRVLDTATLTVLHVISGVTSLPNDISALSPDGDQLLFATGAGMIQRQTLSSGARVMLSNTTPIAGGEPFLALFTVLHNDGAHWAFARAGVVTLMRGNRPVANIPADALQAPGAAPRNAPNDVTQLMFTPDGGSLLVADNRGAVHVLDLVNGARRATLRPDASALPLPATSPDLIFNTRFALSPDGQTLAVALTGAADATRGSLVTFALADGRQLAARTLAQDPLTQLVFARNGTQLVAARQDGGLVWIER